MSLAAKLGIDPPFKPQPSTFVTDDRCVGIEIEQEYVRHSSFEEAAHLSKEQRKYWGVKGDGSLRNNGLEFVSKILYPYAVGPALDSVLPALGTGNYSWRAGIHIHIDVRDLEEDQLESLGAMYALLEPLIFQWEGTGRDTSRFCVPWTNSSEAVHYMYRNIHAAPHDVRMVFERVGKYSALNITPIGKFGTVEFRHLQTIDDKEKIMKYIDMCLCIVEAGVSRIDPAMQLSMHGANNFLNHIFDGRLNFLYEDTGVDCDLMWNGVDVANSIKIAKMSDTNPSSPLNMGSDYIELINKLDKGEN